MTINDLQRKGIIDGKIHSLMDEYNIISKKILAEQTGITENSIVTIYDAGEVRSYFIIDVYQKFGAKIQILAAPMIGINSFSCDARELPSVEGKEYDCVPVSNAESLLIKERMCSMLEARASATIQCETGCMG